MKFLYQLNYNVDAITFYTNFDEWYWKSFRKTVTNIVTPGSAAFITWKCANQLVLPIFQAKVYNRPHSSGRPAFLNYSYVAHKMVQFFLRIILRAC